MTHYYTNNAHLQSQKTKITFYYRQHTITFISDIGVFSKTRVDYGSKALLENIELHQDQHSLLDVGCGYGTLGISLKKEYPWLEIDMVDVNDRALSLAKESSQYNGITDAHIYQSSVYENVTKSFDVIVSNPPVRAGKKIVMEILEKAYDHLYDDGELWIVIQKKQGAPSLKKKMEEVFCNCEIVKRDKGYYILRSKKLR